MDLEKYYELVEEVLKLPVEKREGYLQEVCHKESIRRKVLDDILEEESSFMIDPFNPSLLISDTQKPNELSHGVFICGRRYEIVSTIGKGGMGIVYKAKDKNRFGKIVAVKQMLFGDNKLRKAFCKEAKILAELEHPNLPTMNDFFEENKSLFLVMEYVEGQNLLERLKERKEPFPIADALKWANQLLKVLEYLHSQKPPVIHRDIKPSNLKIDEKKGEIILLDFGLAKGKSLNSSSNTTDYSVHGFTPNYSPPEQIRNSEEKEPRSDVYAFGATLYHLLTNVLPPSASERAIALVTRQDLLIPANKLNTQIPSGLSNLLDKTMSMVLEQRPTTASLLDSLCVFQKSVDPLSGFSLPKSEPLVEIMSKKFVRSNDLSNTLIDKSSEDKQQEFDVTQLPRTETESMKEVVKPSESNGFIVSRARSNQEDQQESKITFDENVIYRRAKVFGNNVKDRVNSYEFKLRAKVGDLSTLLLPYYQEFVLNKTDLSQLEHEEGHLTTIYQDYKKMLIFGTIVLLIVTISLSIAEYTFDYTNEDSINAIKKPIPTATPFSFNTIKVRSNGEVIETNMASANQFVEDLGNGVTLEMVEIPAGVFSVIEPLNSERGSQPTTISTFYMSKYEITQKQWKAIMGEKGNPSVFHNADDLPVEMLSWYNAQEFCKELSKIRHREYRLPMEKEWEYACRAGSMTRFAFGEALNSSIEHYGKLYDKEGYRGSNPVGRLKANAFGLFDMHGNVSEWCQIDKSAGIVRGGSWKDEVSHCGCDSSKKNTLSGTTDDVGFRVVLSP